MTYQWKIPGVYKVDAQTAGEELARIYEKHGRLEPAQIVNESRDYSAPLHPCFEWDNNIAAEKYREVQAGQIIRAIVTVAEKQNGTECVARAYVTLSQKNYEPLSVVIRDEDKRSKLLQTARAELVAFQRKYKMLNELKPVFDAINNFTTN